MTTERQNHETYVRPLLWIVALQAAAALGADDLEVDAIVQKRNGDWCAFEIKLGTGQLEVAAENLKKLVTVLDPAKTNPPKSLNIITGTGIGFSRADGINVFSIAALGA